MSNIRQGHKTLRDDIRRSTQNIYEFARMYDESADPVLIAAVNITEDWAPAGIAGFRARMIEGDDELLYVCEWEWEAGARMPWHIHGCHETIECLSGAYVMYMGDKTWRVTKGDVVEIPAGVVHSGLALADTHIKTTFAPPLSRAAS